MDSNHDPDSAVSIKGVSKSFAGSTVAVRTLEFQANRGEVTGLIGANGSGKTTVLRAIAGELEVDAGSIEVLGTEPFPPNQRLRRRLGLISQQAALDPEMTAGEILRFFGALHGLPRGERLGHITKIANQFGIEGVLSKRISQLSGGFRQRVHLAAGLLHSPDLILADEPTSALDPEARRMVWDLLGERASAGVAVIVASHDLADAERCCHRIAMLASGEKVASGSPREIVARHGATALEADVGTGFDPEPIRSIPSVAFAEVRGNRFTALLDETAVPAVLEALGPVRSYRCEKPNLATVYLRLSGQSLGLPPAPRPRQRKGGRK